MLLNCGVREDSPWTARRSNQSILKEISPGCSLEGMMLKVKLQYFGHFMQRVDSLEKTLMLGGIGGRRRRGRQRMRLLDLLAVQGESSLTPQFKSINYSALSFFIVQLSHPYMTTGKTIAFSIQTFFNKKNVSVFNMLSKLLIPFLSEAVIF